jgi:hypothetical protein
MATSRLVGFTDPRAASTWSEPSNGVLPSSCLWSPRRSRRPEASVRRPAGPARATSRAAQSIAATDALASVAPRPYSRVPSTAGVKGRGSNRPPGGTVSRCDTSASVCPDANPRTSIRTEVSSRTTSSFHPRAVCSTKLRDGLFAAADRGNGHQLRQQLGLSRQDPLPGRSPFPCAPTIMVPQPAPVKHLEQQCVRRAEPSMI